MQGIVNSPANAGPERTLGRDIIVRQSSYSATYLSKNEAMDKPTTCTWLLGR